MKIGNAELELDLFDAEIAGKYEKALKIFNKKQSNKKTGLDLAGTIKQECETVFDFFNDIWGPGTDKKVFGNKTNFRECEKAFKQVVDYSIEQFEEIRSISAQYSVDRLKR